MSPQLFGDHKSLEPESISSIFIVGPRRLQNELMAAFLREKIGATCLIWKDVIDISRSDASEYDSQHKLVLWDCQGKDLMSLLREFRDWDLNSRSSDYVVFFNAPGDLGIEETFVWQTVRGIFYERDSLDKFLEGIWTVLRGKLWLSGQIMS
jgi:hypothetical protein